MTDVSTIKITAKKCVQLDPTVIKKYNTKQKEPSDKH
jgi:hypothetical protein